MPFSALCNSVFVCLILGSQTLYAAFDVIKEKFDNGVVANESYYRDGELVEQRYYNIEGKFSTWLRYSYPQQGHVIKSKLSVEKESFGQIENKEEWTGLDKKNNSTEASLRLKRWVYSDKAPFTLEWVEHYETLKPFRVVQKDYLNKNEELLSFINFTYQDDSEKPAAFVEKNKDGKIISQFSLYEKYDVANSLRRDGKTAAEIEVLKRQRENPHKFLIAVIDSGFDYNHSELAAKWWNNPLEPVDGIDNDGNGWVDDNFGWEQVKNVSLPTESSTSMAKDHRPLSHGTHVAHIAIRGLDNAALIGFAGDYTQASYIDKISAFLKKHHVKIVNMSLGLPHDNKDLLGLRDAIKAYKRMIDENPETLFVVAAGNSEQDLDQSKNRQYPASFTQPNVLKVGALDASDIAKVTPQNAKMAYFSNFGKANVDILAPGVDILAASLGGGLIAHSGTSMASPYMANLVAQLWTELPHLKATEVRELFVQTVQVMPTPAPVRSGGYVDLKAALLKGKMDFLKGRFAKSDGPNCWNSSTYLAGLAKGVHHTYGSEFAFLMDSPLCENVPLEQMQKGDIVALRRFDRHGRLLPAAFLSEVHGYTYAGEGLGFTKNGVHRNAPYELQTREEIFRFYKSSEARNCKMNGLDRKDCNLKELAYRCIDFETYMKAHGGLNVFEKDVLYRISLFEKHLQSELLLGQKSPLSREQALRAIQQALAHLKQGGSSAFVLDYLESRVESLDTVFAVSQ
ncbi:S8 family serine peptidase [Bdellovibrio bacteriovorus]|uniref:S8 family serine peptidase n=1 Tax=Bdellovibrio bacteriovorus TaxID=959 RepID=UPI0035A60C1A